MINENIQQDLEERLLVVSFCSTYILLSNDLLGDREKLALREFLPNEIMLGRNCTWFEYPFCRAAELVLKS